MISTMCLLALMAGQTLAPPPLTEDQVTKVRALVKIHQEEQAGLKTKLEKAQRTLTDCYARYELKDDQISTLQAEVLEVQAKLLRDYDSMQKDLRKIVGPERFRILSRRIDSAIRNPPDSKKSPGEVK